jgi:hypothetical protein
VSPGAEQQVQRILVHGRCSQTRANRNDVSQFGNTHSLSDPCFFDGRTVSKCINEQLIRGFGLIFLVKSKYINFDMTDGALKENREACSRRSSKCCSRPGLSHRDSRVSRVSIDYFDPQGFQELKIALDRLASLETPSLTLTPSGQHDEEEKESEMTLAVGEVPFDIEKSLRLIVKKYVSWPCI